MIKGVVMMMMRRTTTSFPALTRACSQLPKPSTTTTPSQSSSSDRLNDLKNHYKPDKIDRLVLKYFGKKGEKEIPDLVNPEEVDRAKSKARIWTGNISILITVIACYFAAQYGKTWKERGDMTVVQKNLKKHESWTKE